MHETQTFYDICTPRDSFSRFRVVLLSPLTAQKIQNLWKARISKKEKLDNNFH